MSKKDRLRYNRNGIPINKHVSLALLRVMGVEDPFEGRRYDPQFDVAPASKFGKHDAREAG
jgi:hypothetical protein